MTERKIKYFSVLEANEAIQEIKMSGKALMKQYECKYRRFFLFSLKEIISELNCFHLRSK